jgi:hypothetical protein
VSITSGNSPVMNLTKICSHVFELPYVDRWMDRRMDRQTDRHSKANFLFWQLFIASVSKIMCELYNSRSYVTKYRIVKIRTLYINSKEKTKEHYERWTSSKMNNFKILILRKNILRKTS